MFEAGFPPVPAGRIKPLRINKNFGPKKNPRAGPGGCGGCRGSVTGSEEVKQVHPGGCASLLALLGYPDPKQRRAFVENGGRLCRTWAVGGGQCGPERPKKLFFRSGGHPRCSQPAKPSYQSREPIENGLEKSASLKWWFWCARPPTGRYPRFDVGLVASRATILEPGAVHIS